MSIRVEKEAFICAPAAMEKVGNNYQLKVGGNLIFNASGTVTIIGAKVIINP